MSPSEARESIFCEKIGAALAKYPHAKRAGNILYLSGLSARQKDNTIKGVTRLSSGSVLRSISLQTEGVIEK